VPSIPHPDKRAAIVNGACIIVAILAVLGARNSYQTSLDYSGRYPDLYGAARAEIRFAPLLARIPVDAEMGYFTDLDPSQALAQGVFLAAQYAVAPRLLVNVDAGNRPEWAVGNFSKPQDFAAAGEARGYGMAEDLGNGVVLFRRKSS
jgi:hypothetical protein